MAQIDMMSDTLATIHTEYSGIVNVNEEGVFTVDCRDGPTMITAGAMYLQPSAADRAKARKEAHDEKLKADEEFAKSSELESRREAILSGVMDPEPEHGPGRAAPRPSTPERAERR